MDHKGQGRGSDAPPTQGTTVPTCLTPDVVQKHHEAPGAGVRATLRSPDRLHGTCGSSSVRATLRSPDFTECVSRLA